MAEIQIAEVKAQKGVVVRIIYVPSTNQFGMRIINNDQTRSEVAEFLSEKELDGLMTAISGAFYAMRFNGTRGDGLVKQHIADMQKLTNYRRIQ